MNNVRIVFQILNEDDAVPPTYQEIRCHVILTRALLQVANPQKHHIL
jgi:hypothetical protein